MPTLHGVDTIIFSEILFICSGTNDKQVPELGLKTSSVWLQSSYCFSSYTVFKASLYLHGLRRTLIHYPAANGETWMKWCCRLGETLSPVMNLLTWHFWGIRQTMILPKVTSFLAVGSNSRFWVEKDRLDKGK